MIALPIFWVIIPNSSITSVWQEEMLYFISPDCDAQWQSVSMEFMCPQHQDAYNKNTLKKQLMYAQHACMATNK